MQDKQSANQPPVSDIFRVPRAGRVLALDIGTKRVGVAVTDERQITARPLPVVQRRSWKELLKNISAIIAEFDAVALVLGLPYNFDGSESEMSQDARRLARNFSLSLSIPVFLQDERLSTKSAQQNLHDRGFEMSEIRKLIDSEAAAVILGDFLALREEMERKNQNDLINPIQ